MKVEKQIMNHKLFGAFVNSSYIFSDSDLFRVGRPEDAFQAQFGANGNHKESS